MTFILGSFSGRRTVPGVVTTETETEENEGRKTKWSRSLWPGGRQRTRGEGGVGYVCVRRGVHFETDTWTYQARKWSKWINEVTVGVFFLKGLVGRISVC